MSTNYYAHGTGITDPEGLHIGQGAAGWRFLFRAHEQLGLTSKEAWVKFLSLPGVTIRNEYGRDVNPSEMIETVSARSDSDGHLLRPRGLRSALDAHPIWDGHYLVDAEGYELSRCDFS